MILTPEIQNIKIILDSSREALQKIPGVISTGITHSSITGIDKYNPGYQILVLVKNELVLKDIPSFMNGVRVVYRFSGGFKPISLVHSNYQILNSNKYRPLKAGSEITNISSVPSIGSCYVGTLGGFPYLPDGTRVILSNNHVIANDVPGDRTGKAGDIIYQPGCMTEGIGTLAKWIPVNSTGNEVDAAYASINNGIQIDEYGLCNYSIGSTVVPIPGMSVIKTGRTTNCTTGTIEAVDMSVSVDYSDDPNTLSTATFTGQILTSPGFCEGGDSGSVAVTYGGNYNAVGLLFATEADGSAIMNPMSSVEQQLGIEFRGSGSSIAPPSGQCGSIICDNTSFCMSGSCIPKTYAYIAAALAVVGLISMRGS